MRKSIIGAACICLLSALITTQAKAASINIDFGSRVTSTPDTYGGAGQAGTWNFVTTLGLSSNLVDINGDPTSVSLNLTASTIEGIITNTPDSINMPLLTDNFYSTLVADYNDSIWKLNISGLNNGYYDLILYAPSHGEVSTGLMTVKNVAVDELTGLVDNSLVEGISYSIVHGEVTDGTLLLTGSTLLSNFSWAGLSGMQISASTVPIPSAVWLFSTGLIGLIGVARKKAHA